MMSANTSKKPHKITTKAKIRLQYYRLLLQTSNFVDKFWKTTKSALNEDGLYADAEVNDNNIQQCHKSRAHKGSTEDTINSRSPRSHRFRRKERPSLSLSSSQHHDEFYRFQYQQQKKSYALMYLGPTPSYSKVLPPVKVNRLQKLQKSPSEDCLRAVSSDDSQFVGSSSRRGSIIQGTRRRRSSRTRTTNKGKGTFTCEECLEDIGDHSSPVSGIGEQEDAITTLHDCEEKCMVDELHHDHFHEDNEEIQADSPNSKVRISRNRIHLRNPEVADPSNVGWTTQTVETKTMEIVRIENIPIPQSQTDIENKNSSRSLEDVISEMEDVEKDPKAVAKDAKKKAKVTKIWLLKKRKEQSRKAVAETWSSFRDTVYALTHRRRGPSAYEKPANLQFGMKLVDPRKALGSNKYNTSKRNPHLNLDVDPRRKSIPVKLQTGLSKLFGLFYPTQPKSNSSVQTNNYDMSRIRGYDYGGYNISRHDARSYGHHPMPISNGTYDFNNNDSNVKHLHHRTSYKKKPETYGVENVDVEASSADDFTDDLDNFHHKPQARFTKQYATLLRK